MHVYVCVCVCVCVCVYSALLSYELYTYASITKVPTVLPNGDCTDLLLEEQEPLPQQSLVSVSQSGLGHSKRERGGVVNSCTMKD